MNFKNILFLLSFLTSSLIWAQNKKCTQPNAVLKYHDVKISLFYGYIDQRPYKNTLDLEHASQMANELMAPCYYPQQSLCGFQLINEDINFMLLERFLNNKKIQIQIISSSISSNDDVNRTDLVQKKISDRNQSLFMNELLYSDVVIYQGHSRYGFGPDFSVPQLKGDSTDKAYYQKEAVNFKKLKNQLALRASRLPILGLFSCDSNSHFGPQLKHSKWTDMLFLTQSISYSSQLQKPLRDFLNNIMVDQCLEQDMQNFTFYYKQK